jgi:YidC/Oxa1 family membrane protein insertase
MAIRNKYKNRNDQASMQKMQQEIQEFYQKENFSPYSGCFQLVLQMPIIMALYYIVIDPLHYVLGKASVLSNALSTFYQTPIAAGGMGGTLTQGSKGIGTIEILSVLKDKGLEAFSGLKEFAFFKDGGAVFGELSDVIGNIPKFNIGKLNLGEIPSFTNFGILLLVPVLTFAIYFVSSKLNRKLMNTQPPANSEIEKRQMACSNVMMDVMMPLLSASFTFMVPAVVGIYWIFRCLLNMLKQFIMSKAMPLPVFTEEDYKAAAKEMAGKKVVKKSNNVGKVRSLHHIDDEDFDDTRERALARKAAIEEREREEQAEQAEKTEKTPLATAPVKKDSPKKNPNKNKPQNITLPKSYKKEETEEVVAPVEENTQNDSEKKIDEE